MNAFLLNAAVEHLTLLNIHVILRAQHRLGQRILPNGLRKHGVELSVTVLMRLRVPFLGLFFFIGSTGRILTPLNLFRETLRMHTALLDGQYPVRLCLVLHAGACGRG